MNLSSIQGSNVHIFRHGGLSVLLSIDAGKEVLERWLNASAVALT